MFAAEEFVTITVGESTECLILFFATLLIIKLM